MSERDGYPAGVPCWVDLWQDDPEAAARFYAGLFGWEVEETTPSGSARRYFMCRLRGRDVAALGSPAAGAGWLTYVRVENADQAADRATAAGGSVVAEPSDALDGGRIAIVADPSGPAFGVWQQGDHGGAELVNEPGAWSMSVLHTPDVTGATAFLGAVLGWQPEPFGDFTLFRRPGYVGGEPQQPVPRDVVAAIAPSEAAPRWLIDFWIDDVDAAAGKAAPLGGRVVAPPFATPVGRTAVIADPAGAEFTITQIVPAA
jgi:uncharacterized protein